MSAKDKAFDAERAKYRQKIRALELEKHKALEREYLLHAELSKCKDELQSKEEHVNRLLEYMDYQPEEFVEKVKSEKAISTLVEMMGVMGGIYTNGCK